MIILSMLVIGAAAFTIHSASQAVLYRNKLLALEIAGNRLEEIRALKYSDILPPALNYNPYYVTKQSGSWVVSDVNPQETVTIHGSSMPITTTVTYVDKNPADGTDTYDYLLAAARVGYRTTPDERLELHTYLGSYK